MVGVGVAGVVAAARRSNLLKASRSQYAGSLPHHLHVLPKPSRPPHEAVKQPSRHERACVGMASKPFPLRKSVSKTFPGAGPWRVCAEVWQSEGVERRA